jgi:methylenetetrahydrofolate dehydrogenase (NADP+) / methenyltetrahydrofolate cyclohydrolase
MAVLFSGVVARERIQPQIIKRLQRIGKDVSLTILFPEQNENQNSFLRAKEREAHHLGVEPKVVHIPKDASIGTYEKEIEKAAKHSDGILIQLPISKGLDTQTILNAVPYDKDVEALSARRFGEVFQDEASVYSPVAKAAVNAVYFAMDALDREPATQNICIVGFNNLTGKPATAVLSRTFGSISICRSHTPEETFKKYLADADVIISSTGKIDLITPDMIKEGSVLIDVGFERGEDGDIHGDFHPDCEKKAGFMTPVPGGLGPLTVTYIYDNLATLLEEKTG